MPVESDNKNDCAESCNNSTDCVAFTFHKGQCSSEGEACPFKKGCCTLKGPGFATNKFNSCSCSGQLRALPDGSEPVSFHGFGNLTRCREEAQGTHTAVDPPKNAKNVLYILVDDLRPELTAYGRKKVHAPNIQRLADSGLVFDRAYCNIAVCSPSRMSFLSGRLPTTIDTYNFVNHIRQATCSKEHVEPLVAYTGTPLQTTSQVSGNGGECCTQCSYLDECKYWTYSNKGSNCTLYAKIDGSAPAEDTISGPRGSFQTVTSLPENFVKHGYISLSSGKVFHTEQGGTLPGGKEVGYGNPPNEDPQSWTPGCSMDGVNLVANNWACSAKSKKYIKQGCPVNATREGEMLDLENELVPFEDKVIADEALKKLDIASGRAQRTGKPFFLAVGFRKPHMPWKFPAPWLDELPPLEETVLALHPTMDPSTPVIAHHGPDLQGDPFHFPSATFNVTMARAARQFYHAAVAWTDFQVGRVLDALDATGLANDTLVVFHSDHGWALGEHGQWQKFNNWEIGVRVPLVIRAPWLPQSAGKRSTALVELVDMYRTMSDLAGVPLPDEAAETWPIDGKSLGDILRNSDDASVNEAVLSVFPRCPKVGGNGKNFGPFNQNASEFWEDNHCEMVDRSMIPWMGYSIRTEDWRYTEWAAWDGKLLKPDFSKPLAGRELYAHTGDDGTNYDAFENENLAGLGNYSAVVDGLSKKLRSMA